MIHTHDLSSLPSSHASNKLHPLSVAVATAIAGALLMSTPVLAAEIPLDEETIEHIVIKGQYRAQGVEDVPASMSVLTEDDVRKRQAEHLEHALAMAANVHLSSGAARATFIQIRGIGERSQWVDPINSSVGMVIDGINYSSLGATGTLFDIGQVEVFRGPQTTRFGVDGMAGMLYLSSREITLDTDGVVEVTAANYNSWGAGFAATHWLNNDAAARVSVYQHKSDGFIHNTFLDRKDTQQQDELSLRLNTQWQFHPDWSTQLTYHHFDINNGYDTWSLDGDRTTLSDEPGLDALKSHAGRVFVSYTGQPTYEMQLSLTYLNGKANYEFDEDWAFEGIRPGWEYNSYDQYIRDRQQWEAEARWLSQQPISFFGVDTDWTLGVYAQRRDQDMQRLYTYFEAPFSSQYETNNRAAYGELNIHLHSQWTLNLGARYEGYSNHYLDSRAIQADPKKSAWATRSSLEFQSRPHETLFISAAHGFKAGGVNGEALGRVDEKKLEQFKAFLEERSVFDPEELTTVELGYRRFIPEQSIRYALTAFYSWREKMQVSAYVEKEAVFVTYIDNAAKGRNYGLEAEFEYLPTDTLRLFASLGWLRTEHRGLVLQDGTNLTGREQAHAPRYSMHAGLEWALASNWYWRAEVDGRDSFYFSNSHDEQSRSYALLHSRLAYTWGDWEFSLFARNLLDRDYETRGFNFGNDPRKDFATETYVQYGEPRRVGVAMRYQF